MTVRSMTSVLIQLSGLFRAAEQEKVLMRLPKINLSQHWFARRILERGYDYYVSGRIQQVQKTAQGWNAVVHGTETYHVEITMDGCNVTDMHCTCPYAAERLSLQTRSCLAVSDHGRADMGIQGGLGA